MYPCSAHTFRRAQKWLSEFAGHSLLARAGKSSERATNAQANLAFIAVEDRLDFEVNSKTQGQGSNGYLLPKTMNPDGNEGPLTYGRATVSSTAASQSIWPVEPAANGQDNQLMRILSYQSTIVKP